MPYFDLRVNYSDMEDSSMQYVCVTNEFTVDSPELPKFLSELTRILQTGGTAQITLPVEMQKSWIETHLGENAIVKSITTGTDASNVYVFEKIGAPTVETIGLLSTPKFIIKSGDEQKAYFPVHTPNKVDADGHYFTAEALKKGCERFESIRKNIDRNHDFQFLAEDEVEVIDNFIASGEEIYTNFDGTKVSPLPGQWIVGLYFKSDELWSGVKDGTYSAVSLFGQGFFEDGDESELKN